MFWPHQGRITAPQCGTLTCFAKCKIIFCRGGVAATRWVWPGLNSTEFHKTQQNEGFGVKCSGPRLILIRVNSFQPITNQGNHTENVLFELFRIDRVRIKCELHTCTLNFQFLNAYL